MNVYKAKIQSDGSLDKLKSRIVVRGDLKNKEIVGDTLYMIELPLAKVYLYSLIILLLQQSLLVLE